MSSRSKKIVGGIVGFAVTFIAGVAVAAILLSTTITGNATIRTAPGEPTPDPVTSRSVSASGTHTGGLDCRQVGVSADWSTLTFKPVLTRPAGGQTGNESCTVTMKVRNTGTSTLTVDGSSGFTAPAGWRVGGISGDAVTGPIAPGQVKSATVTLTATPAAEEGEFSGKLVYKG